MAPETASRASSALRRSAASGTASAPGIGGSAPRPRAPCLTRPLLLESWVTMLAASLVDVTRRGIREVERLKGLTGGRAATAVLERV